MSGKSDSSAGNKLVTDLSYLREVVMGDEEIMIETTKKFIEETPHVLERMEDHFSHQEWEELYKQAHKIKPNLEYMGMSRARDLVLDIEKQAKSHEISENLGHQIEEFTSICLKSIKELSDKIEELEASLFFGKHIYPLSVHNKNVNKSDKNYGLDLDLTS